MSVVEWTGPSNPHLLGFGSPNLHILDCYSALGFWFAADLSGCVLLLFFSLCFLLLFSLFGPAQSCVAASFVVCMLEEMSEF